MAHPALGAIRSERDFTQPLFALTWPRRGIAAHVLGSLIIFEMIKAPGCQRCTEFWVAHASRVLVLASRQNDLLLISARGVIEIYEESSRSRGRNRQHARRVRYPELCGVAGTFSQTLASHSRAALTSPDVSSWPLG